MTDPASLRINAARLHSRLIDLSKVGRDPAGGVSRLAFSEADREACSLVMTWMRAAGLDTAVDFAGNVVGRRPGSAAARRPLVFGSHVDSVPNGGDYDGPLGTIAAIEVAQVLVEGGVRNRHPLELRSWANEEGGLHGSRAVSGQIAPHEMTNVARSGRTIADGMAFLGGDPHRLGEVRQPPGSIAAYVELHIEQGAALEEAGIDIGIVEGIVGIRQWEVTFDGVANHAGTTPMDRRHDALLAAARFIDAGNRIVTSEPGAQRGAVGRIAALPGAANLIAGRVPCTLELRVR